MADSSSPPNTSAQLSHAMVIVAAGSSAVIGAINEWNPKSSRALTDLYAFGAGNPNAAGVSHAHSADPFEVVPGNISGLQIDVRRWDLYNDQLESTFGGPNTGMLSDHLDAFGCREKWSSPGNANNYVRWYYGCWFSDEGRSYDAKGERSVNVNATIRYTRRARIIG